MSLEGKFSPLFFFSLVFSPQPNSGKCHFPPYLSFTIFHPPCFHPNQTYPYSMQDFSILPVFTPTKHTLSQCKMGGGSVSLPFFFFFFFLVEKGKGWQECSYIWAPRLIWNTRSRCIEDRLFQIKFLDSQSLQSIYVPT